MCVCVCVWRFSESRVPYGIMVELLTTVLCPLGLSLSLLGFLFLVSEEKHTGQCFKPRACWVVSVDDCTSKMYGVSISAGLTLLLHNKEKPGPARIKPDLCGSNKHFPLWCLSIIHWSKMKGEATFLVFENSEDIAIERCLFIVCLFILLFIWIIYWVHSFRSYCKLTT